MWKIKPFQTIVIAVFVLLAIFGVFVFANFTGGQNKKAQVGDVVIWGTLPKDAVGAGLQELTAKDNTYTGVTYVEKSPQTFDSELANALASGTGPDLVILNQEALASERDKLSIIPFSTLSQRSFVDSYTSLFQSYLSSTGTYGIPLVLDPMVFYYNRALLSSAGVATPPTTWEAVAGLSGTLTKRTGSGELLQSMISFGGYDNVRNARGILSLLMLQAGSPITQERDGGIRSVIGGDALGQGGIGLSPAASAVNYYAQFGDPAKTIYSWNRSMPESRAAFLSGKLVFYVGFASEYPYLLSANPNLDFDITKIPQPGTATTRITYGLGYAFSVPKVAKNGSGALAVAFALSADKPMQAIAGQLGMVPARRALLTPPADNVAAAVTYPEALGAKGWLSPLPSPTDGIFSAMMSNITSGRQDVTQAVNTAGGALDAALR